MSSKGITAPRVEDSGWPRHRNARVARSHDHAHRPRRTRRRHGMVKSATIPSWVGNARADSSSLLLQFRQRFRRNGGNRNGKHHRVLRRRGLLVTREEHLVQLLALAQPSEGDLDLLA